MPRTIRIRNIEDEVYLALSRRAAEDGLSVPELLRREAIRLATRPTVAATAQIRMESARRLAALGGTDPEATA
ncbi:MAG: hypothetical protein J7518_19175 [Nocardioidaceae bacterium]|nr:hypothetical protein [Nocardioidaceae bacterium]